MFIPEYGVSEFDFCSERRKIVQQNRAAELIQ